MIRLQLTFSGNGQQCSAAVELEGIADSWDADVKVTGHPAIQQLHVKFWLGSFLMPVFDNRQDAIFFEPLLEMVAEQAKENLPEVFE